MLKHCPEVIAKTLQSSDSSLQPVVDTGIAIRATIQLVQHSSLEQQPKPDATEKGERQEARVGELATAGNFMLITNALD